MWRTGLRSVVFVALKQMPIKAIACRLGVGRNTVWRALAAERSGFTQSLSIALRSADSATHQARAPAA